MRKLLLVGAMLAGTAAVLWSGLNLPPPLWLLKYGPAPGCEPTGEVVPVEGVEFVVIGPGCLRIGSTTLRLPWGIAPKPSIEMPVHYVEFPRGFAVARTQVTMAQYERFDPDYERSRLGDPDPGISVRFGDATAYCAWLAERTGRPVRLPSEAEWAAASRGHEGGKKKGNAWGLHGFDDNAREWLEDTWHPSYLGAPVDGSAWILGGFPRGDLPRRVIRGGGLFETSASRRSSARVAGVTTYFEAGFRPAFTPAPR